MQQFPDTIILVRHGETNGNSAVRLNGATDVGLSDVGEQQMARVAAALRGERFDAVLVSPLGRSRESAAIVLEGRGPIPLVIEGFREVDFGAWEGLTLDEVRERDPHNHALWLTSGESFVFPEGDGRRAFRERVARAAREHLSPARGRVLCVLHKGVIKGILAELLGWSHAEAHAAQVHLGSIHRLVREGEGWRLATANETEHLGELHLAG